MNFAETRRFYRKLGKRKARREFTRGYWVGVLVGVVLLSAFFPDGLRASE